MSKRRRWERLDDPPEDVTRVRIVRGGSVFTRMERGGYYWSARGWESGVDWAQVLRWGPVEEVLDGE